MRILCFQHQRSDNPGIFLEFWRAAGHALETVDLDLGQPIPPLEDFDLLVVMGGPMQVWQEEAHPWLVPEKAAILDWVRRLEKPYLGVCLGHQLLGDVLGGTVEMTRKPEVGINAVDLSAPGRADPLFAGLGPTLEVMQWHGAEVSAAPDGVAILARSPRCEVQAMRFGRHAYGTQFHMEICTPTAAIWEANPNYRAGVEAANGPGSAAGHSARTAAKMAGFNATAARVNANLMAIIAEGNVTR